jgi:hypothetical protein
VPSAKDQPGSSSKGTRKIIGRNDF